MDLIADRWKTTSAKKAMRSALHPVILSVTAWKIARKLRLGKLQLPCSQARLLPFLNLASDRFQLKWVDLSPEICHEAELLPILHEDSFDRMILALAKSHGVPILTCDRRFEAYPVQVTRHR